MSAVIFVILLPIVFLAYVVYRLVRRGNELKQIVQDGIESSGTVTRAVTYGSARKQHYLHYEYRDGNGGLHTQRSLVSADFWASHPEGAPIAIVYSASRPSLAAPLELIEQARQALRVPK